MEFVENILSNYGYLLYLVILVWTFVEGETIVIITGAIAAEGRYNINVELLALCAFVGSFAGDQLYYYIGRKYGAPLLVRWPTLNAKIEWAFHLVKTHPKLFILSFRFIYGIRNVAPFVIGISGVSRMQYFVLNFIAAQIWAHSFAWGGYMVGVALAAWLGAYKWHVMGGFIVLIAAIAAFGYLRQKRKLARIDAIPQPAPGD